ncbi:uncharacterized protein LOC134842251 [Symsagittifera roscoffensis]|uniref:uncharacterized protein LOC134842251 n=1 Tax=Symsagittifera roscoffensis TaxID=84072 RepID=UPI00307CBFA3
MGASYTRLPANNPAIPFCIISFFHDQIHIFNADSNLVSLVRNCLQSHYPKGIQKESMRTDAVIFKCSGYPFSPIYSSTDHRNFLNFACALLKELSQAGYIKVMSGDFCWYSDLSAWFFYKSPCNVATDIEFCAIDLWGWDKLKLFSCPPEINDAIKYVVAENWKGIQRAEYEEECFTIKMKGYPWQSPSGEDGVKNRLLIMKIMQSMGQYGWTLYSATNVDAATDVLFFCRKKNLYISPAFTQSIFAISLNRNDRLRLMNADGAVQDIIQGVIRSFWPEIQNEGDHYGSYEFKLKGTPWWARGESAMPSVTLLCQLFTALRRSGWKAIMNLDISRSQNDKGVFFFVRMPPKDVNYCALSVKGSSNIYGVHLTPEITSHLQQIIQGFFDFSRQPEQVYGGQATKWSLQCIPWASVGKSPQKFNSQLMIAGLINGMIGFNYHLCSSADISSIYVHRDKAPDYKPDGDTMFFGFDDPPFNVGLFTDIPAYTPPPDFYSSSAPPPPPSYDILFSS